MYLIDRRELGMEDTEDCYDPFWEYRWYCDDKELDTDVINPVEDGLEGIIRDRVLFGVRDALLYDSDSWPDGFEP